MHSSLSQQLALSEPPASRGMTSDTEIPPSYRKDLRSANQLAVYKKSANQRKAHPTSQFRALPAPPTDKPRDLKQRKPSVIHEEPRKPEQNVTNKPNNIVMERQRDRVQHEQVSILLYAKLHFKT